MAGWIRVGTRKADLHVRSAFLLNKPGSVIAELHSHHIMYAQRQTGGKGKRYQLNIDLWPLTQIKPYAKNPRIIPQEAVKALAAAIEKVGFNDPIEVDEAGEILSGHTRFLAAKSLGLKKVPVIQHVGLDEEQKKAYRIQANKLGELTEWDRALLTDEMSGMELFDATDLGFNDKEIGKLFDLAKDGDPLPEPIVERKHCCRPGEIWDLGDHQLQVGMTNFGAADEVIELWQKKTKQKAKLDGQDYAAVKAEREAEDLA